MGSSGRKTAIHLPRRRLAQPGRPGLRALVGSALLLLSASCVEDHRPLTAGTVAPPAGGATGEPVPAGVPLEATALQPISAAEAAAANAALPLAQGQDGGASAFFLSSRHPVDQLRSLDCLAQAIYYEARSEGEDGQRAVAQVVLNRMRHPAYPASVCGVVYQGPMRAGGGCQFTFTCDGSLGAAPSGEGWLRARRIAAAALSGSVYAPVGHATHYHTLTVFPLWAPTLVKSAVIGNHIFYRLPGAGGAAAAFSQRYAGSEPLPVPRQIFFKPAPVRSASLALPAGAAAQAWDAEVTAPPDALPPVRMTDLGRSASRVREAFLNSGRIREVPLETGGVPTE